MSAPAINAATPPSTAPAPGIGAGAPAAQGPLAGFEALLAAFFGAQGMPVAPGQIGMATTTAKPGAAAGAPNEGANADGDTTTATTAEDPKTNDAAAAAQAACDAAALVLPTAALPIANANANANANATGETATGEAGKGEAALAKAAAHFKGPAKTATPTLAPNAKGEPIVTEAEAAATSSAQLDPKALAPAPAEAVTIAKLAPSVTTKPNPPESSGLAVPQQVPPAPAPVASPPPEIPLDAPVAAVVEALAAPQAAVDAKATEQAAPIAPAPSKDKAQGAKAGRNEHGRVDMASPSLARSGAVAPPAAGSPPDNAAEDHFTVQAAGPDTRTKVSEAPPGSADAGAATTSTTNASTQIHPGAIPVRGAPQTVANLAAQIAKKLEGRSTRFDLQLDPAGLGRVDVRMEIGATGRMTAAMTFDTPQAAAELRSRAAELQRHLEQAGFDMSGGLSFDVAGDRGQGRQAPQNQDNDSGQAFRGRAFQQALATAGEAAQSAASGALNLRRSLLSGVDIRI